MIIDYIIAYAYNTHIPILSAVIRVVSAPRYYNTLYIIFSEHYTFIFIANIV